MSADCARPIGLLPQKYSKLVWTSKMYLHALLRNIAAAGATAITFFSASSFFVLALPEGVRAELIDGKMYYMASPTMTHQRLIMGLSAQIYNHIREHGGGCQVFPAPFAVFIMNDKRNYFEPDIVVVCDPDKLDEAGCHGAPDWVIEIVSPSSKTMDYYKKAGKYAEAGVREYWIVDPAREAVVICRMEKGEEPVIYPFTDKLASGILEGLELDVQAV